MRNIYAAASITRTSRGVAGEWRVPQPRSLKPGGREAYNIEKLPDFALAEKSDDCAGFGGVGVEGFGVVIV